MKTIYIAGPYRAKTRLGVLLNILKARKAAKELSKEGWCVFTPHMNTALFDGICSDKFWLDCGMEFLKRSDAIFLLKKWRLSEGAKEEYWYSCNYGKTMYYEVEGYPEP